MAKAFIAIDPQKKVYELSESGIRNLERLHKAQGVKGWVYGPKAAKPTLLAKVVTPAEAQSLASENAELKARLAALEAKTEVPVVTEVQVETAVPAETVEEKAETAIPEHVKKGGGRGSK